MRAIHDREFGCVKKAVSQRENSVKSKKACCVTILLKCLYPSWRWTQAIQIKAGRLKCHVTWLKGTAFLNMVFDFWLPLSMIQITYVLRRIKTRP